MVGLHAAEDRDQSGHLTGGDGYDRWARGVVVGVKGGGYTHVGRSIDRPHPVLLLRRFEGGVGYAGVANDGQIARVHDCFMSFVGTPHVHRSAICAPGIHDQRVVQIY